MKNLTIICATFFFLFACQQKENAPQEEQSTDTFDEAAEEAAMLKTIEEETACFYRRDFDCWQSFFVQADHAFQAWNNPDGTFDAEVGWKAIGARSQSYMKNNPVPEGGSSHPKVDRHNLLVKFYGPNMAYLIWDQYNSSPDTKFYNHSKESRILEKMGDTWKIVNVTAFWDYKNEIPVDSLKMVLSR